MLTRAYTEFVDKLVRDVVGSRIMETILRFAPDEMVQQLFNSYFKDNLTELSFDKNANFAVQRLFERLTKPEDVNNALGLLDETIGLLCAFSLPQGLILAETKVAVAISLIEACIRTNADRDKAHQVSSNISVSLIKLRI